mgnify:CR=1 FL=1
MTDKDYQEEPEEETSAPVPQEPEPPRRHFLKGAAAGTVLFSLAGRPAWANNCSESGRMSGNLSGGEEACNGGEGCSTGFWSGPGWDQWHEDLRPGALFSDVFRADPFEPGATLGQVIQGQAGVKENGLTGDPDFGEQYSDHLKRWGEQLVAALQNAASPVDFGMTVLEVDSLAYNNYQIASRQTDAKQAKDVIERSQSYFQARNRKYCPLDAGFSANLSGGLRSLG